jgi:hypothetical protein
MLSVAERLTPESGELGIHERKFRCDYKLELAHP